MMDVVVAEDVEAWDASLTALTDGLGWLFARPEPRVTFGQLVRAMLADVPKKNCWGMAEYTGLANPKRFQLLLREGSWDEELLRDWVRGYVLRGLADAAGVLVVDDTQVIKKGVKSVGVAPQHCGATGQTENCQVMVMLSYALDARARVHRPAVVPANLVGRRRGPLRRGGRAGRASHVGDQADPGGADAHSRPGRRVACLPVAGRRCRLRPRPRPTRVLPRTRRVLRAGGARGSAPGRGAW